MGTPVPSAGTWALLRQDFRANARGLPDRPTTAQLLRALARNAPTMRFAAVVLLRLAQAAGTRVGLLGSLVKQGSHLVTGCDIAFQARIGPGLVLYHPTGVVVGPDCRIGARARILQHVTIGSDEVMMGAEQTGSPTLGDDVVIGPGAVITGGIELGDRVQVGANAVVTRSFPSDVVIAGAPARVIRMGDST